MDPKVTDGKPPGPGTASPVTDIVIITGMSGAGRSTAAKTLEDLDWFVIDNLPPGLLPTMINLARRAKGALPKIAAVTDVRSRAFSSDLQSAISELATRGVRPRVVFLEAADDTLVRRFESVRRPHPLQEDGRVLDGIAAAPRVSVVSFGYKYGLPVDADLVADCRFLPNPHWVPALRPLSGCDAAVRDYVLSQPGATQFLDAYLAVLEVSLAGFEREGRRYVTLAVGCTGGKHRSVAIAEQIAARLGGRDVTVSHRDLGRE